MLRGRVGCYALISTISVYQQGNFTQAGTHEDSPVEVLDDPTNETITGESYGGLKALCEARAQHHFKQAAFIIRPGFIVGPHDPTFRFHYWVARAAQGGTMLAPGQPDQPLQVIDVRDLAAWTLLGIAHGLGGVYNATGPIEPLHWGDFLQTACQVAGAGTQLAWVDESFLLAQAVEPFATLPLWPPAELNGVHQTSIAKAVAGGLTFRPLEQTIRASLPFALEMARALPDSDSSLRAEREADLLAAWHLYLQNGASA
jgi:2'-hydroxyisoflavone reductase